MMSGGGGGGDTPTKKIAKSENEGQECFETPFEVHSNHIIFAHAYKVYNSFILSICVILSKPEMESGMYRHYLTCLSMVELHYLSPESI